MNPNNDKGAVGFLHPRQPPGSPPAIWTAFARASAWKNWVLVAQFGVIGLSLLSLLKLSARPPDVVTIDSEGNSTYVGRHVAGEALLRFLAEQKGQPPDVAVVRFTKEFLTHFLALNSSTIRTAWPEALKMMTAALRDRTAREAQAQKLIENLEHAQMRTDLTVREILLVERNPNLFHVRATVTRAKSRLTDASSPSSDTLDVDLVLAVVQRFATRPDGLEIAELQVRARAAGSDLASPSPARP